MYLVGAQGRAPARRVSSRVSSRGLGCPRWPVCRAALPVGCLLTAGALTFRVIGPRKRPFIFDGFFFGGSHTLFETVGKPKMRSTPSCWPSKSRVPRKKFRPNRTGRFGTARLWNLVTPLSGRVSAALWLLSDPVEMDLLGSLCSANVGPSPVLGESQRANRVWMWEKNKRVFSFRCQNGASERKSDLL